MVDFNKVGDGERKASNAGMSLPTERYRVLYEQANDAILISRPEQCIECNEMALRLFGCTHKEELIGRFPWEFNPPIQPDGSPSHEKAMQLMTAALAGTPQRFQWRYLQKNGAHFDAEVSLNRIALGDTTCLQASVRDVGEWKKMEQALRESEKQFRSMVEMTSDWAWAVDENGVYTYLPAVVSEPV